ncbi:tigger transposable element-derived protein 1-like [Homarus americanus]|uniref:tigger transposable element-derived protein 1-like n=1 Tax=Homarus americanus TaxID=6706 RepID=UPI001C479CE2|nr:tigger transposable element-derived protein 1-like [Homarus americanus]
MPKCTCTIPSSSEKKKRKTFNIGDKVKILNEFEQGASASVVARRYGVNESTIRGIRQKADKIHAAFAEPTVSKTTQHLRPPLYQEMEDTLKIWIENMQRRKVAISGPMIKNEAMEIQTRLLQRDGKPVSECKFTASQGWLHSFIKRAELRCVCVSGEAASADTSAREKVKIYSKKAVEERSYTPVQIGNCDATEINWKKMPKKAYLKKANAKAPGFKASEDRVTVLFCANVKELLDSMDDPITTEEALELAEMTKEHEEEEEAEDVPPHVKKEWKITQLKEYMTFIYAAIKCIRDNDPDLGRATENVDSLYRLSSTYSRLLDRKIANQKQRSTTSYFRCSS